MTEQQATGGIEISWLYFWVADMASINMLYLCHPHERRNLFPELTRLLLGNGSSSGICDYFFRLCEVKYIIATLQFLQLKVPLFLKCSCPYRRFFLYELLRVCLKSAFHMCKFRIRIRIGFIAIQHEVGLQTVWF